MRLPCTTNEDGTFSINQINSNVNNALNTDIAAAVVLTFVGGGSISPSDNVDNSGLNSKFVLDRDVSSGGIDSFSTAGYTTISVDTPVEDLISIGLSDPSLSDLLNENSQFSGLQESQTFVEFFQPEAINDEDFTIYPQNGIFLPIAADSDNGDEGLRNIINEGILVNNEDDSLNNFAGFAPTLEGGFTTYNPDDFTNVSNNTWNSLLGQTGRTTLFFGKEIPIRSTLPPRFFQGKPIPPRTHGVFTPLGGIGDIKFVSGQSKISQIQRAEIISSSRSFEVSAGELLTPKQVNDRVRITLVHAEGHAATTIRALNLQSGRIVINNSAGPCGNCRTGIPKILPEGATLEVVYINNSEQLVIDTFTAGQLFNPSRDRKTFDSDF